MIAINGKAKDQWSVTDRAFLYGDGCFTTMLVKAGVIIHWQEHLTRLKRDTKALAISPINWQQLEQDVFKIAQDVRHESRIALKILVSRGMGGQGYSPIGCNSPTLVISTHTYPSHYFAWQKKGVSLVFLQQRLGHSPLAGIKHLNRLEQVLLKQELSTLDADEGIACCIHGKLIETTSGNIFWRKGKTLFTPDLSLAGVLGTERAIVIKLVAQMGWDIEILDATAQDLYSADEIFICNALMELVPVNKVEGIRLKDHSLCKKLMLRL